MPEKYVKFFHQNRPAEVLLYDVKAPYEVSGLSIKGALEIDPQTDRLRCHEEGMWFKSLASHITLAHPELSRFAPSSGLKLSRYRSDSPVAGYKLKHGLPLYACLWNEARRRKAIQHAVQLRFEGKLRLRPPGSAGLARGVKFLTTHRRNLRGSCMEQLLRDLRVFVAKNGRVPTTREMNSRGIFPYSGSAIRRKFGSIAAFFNAAGFPTRLTGRKLKDWTRGTLISILKDFAAREKRLPFASDWRRGLLPSLRDT